jgi:trimeric autotransporter adhesin
MRLNRSLGVASNPEPARGHRAGAGVVRTLSVAALAAAACALSALPALAASAAPTGTAATTTTITYPANGTPVAEDAGVTVQLSATVTDSTGGAVTSGTVAFVPTNLPAPIPSVLECTAAPLNSAGVATCNVTPAVGTWGFVLYEATYSGDATYATSTSTGEHKVITWDITTTHLTFSPSPATEGNPVTLTATVLDQPLDALADAYGGPDQVTFSIGGTAIPGCSDVNVTDPSDGPDNVATCTYTPTATGSVSIKAAYLGDDYALPSSDTETLTVDAPASIATKTTVSVPKTAKAHTSVKMSVTVTSLSGSTIPTGTVTLWVSTRELCKGTLSDGKYSCEEGFPNPGPKTIVAKYSGDSTHKASSGSAPLTITKS